MSGGVDSVVLLDSLVREQNVAGFDPWQNNKPGTVIVAHFDHGIRGDSAEDEVFVRKLAAEYGCEYRSRREELGANASEETARYHRYRFLKEVCREFDGQLVTAHHMNDIAETVVINVVRGTGWRGVAVMDTPAVWRPFLAVTKQEILHYADQHSLIWREDSTNTSQKYLRNRIRQRVQDEQLVRELAALRARQTELKQLIDGETHALAGVAPYSRYFFSHCGDMAAHELLRTVFISEKGRSVTIPARTRALHAIKVAKHGSAAQVSEGITLRFTRTHFIVE